MKLLHLNSYYSKSEFYKNLYDLQAASGLKIDVYVPVSRGLKPILWPLGKYTTLNINHGKYDRVIFNVKHGKIYKDLVQQYNIKDFALLHAHSLFSNGYLALKLKEAYQVPYLVAVRDTDVNVFFKYMVHLRGLGVQILEKAAGVVFLSKSYRDYVLKKYVPPHLQADILQKSTIIPNGIADFWFRNKGQVRPVPEGKNLKLLYVGVLERRKNIATTIKAIKILQGEGYRVDFTIVGHIKNQFIYQQIKNLPFVNYLPYQPQEELLALYRRHDIFIMPSKRESFGLVYAEAMSQGLPVIYTKGQGFDEQFTEGCVGYSVPCYAAQEIAARVQDVLANYQVLSERCLQKLDSFNWEQLSEKYRQLYSQIIN